MGTKAHICRYMRIDWAFPIENALKVGCGDGIYEPSHPSAVKGPHGEAATRLLPELAAFPFPYYTIFFAAPPFC